jgi:RNA polymerase sigma-70 factor (ECF subfamily)
VTDPNLEELMLAYVAGDANAFDHLYRRLAPQLFAYLIRLTRDRSRAEDLLQVTFAKLHRARATYLYGAPLLPWAFAIARRSFLDERRSAKSRSEDLSSDGILPEPKRTDETNLDDVSDAIDQAIDRLPEAYREAIQLTKVVGLSLIEAAKVLETTPTAVKLRVHRGCAMLREQLQNFQRSSA